MLAVSLEKAKKKKSASNTTGAEQEPPTIAFDAVGAAFSAISSVVDAIVEDRVIL